MRVLVVGAGAAGLRATMLLHRQGIDVGVVEARDRVGGRLHTVRTTNGYWDAGGEWIDADHHRVLNLMRELGVEAEATEEMGGWLCWEGEKWPEEDPPPTMRQAESDFLASARRDLANLPTVDHTLTDALRAIPKSPEGNWYVTAKYRSDEGEDLERVGWRCWLQAFRLYAERAGDEMSQYRVSGGAQMLADLMARGLPSVDLGREVVAIEQGEKEVGVSFVDGTQQTADFVIVTCPPPIVSTWNWLPALPTQDAWRRARMGCAVKVSLHFETRFWESLSFPGRLLADRSFQQLWDSSHGGMVVLQFYVCGDEGRRLQEGASVVEEWLSEVEDFLPGLRQYLSEYQVHDWYSDKFSKGGFSTWGPGDDLEVKPYLVQPHGRVHFAGEHTATWCGFIEGALESAERAAQEVLCRC